MRLKTNEQKLAEEMLAQIPKAMFESKNKTFMIPDIAGGQFPYAVETELKKYGHSDKNISGRVFGYAANHMTLNYAVNKYNLIGSYKVGSFIGEAA